MSRLLLRVGLLSLIVVMTFQPTVAQIVEQININSASVAELMRLPGIGPTMAARIVDYRQRHGPFRRPQEIVIVQRMSPKLYRRIAHLIRI